MFTEEYPTLKFDKVLPEAGLANVQNGRYVKAESYIPIKVCLL
jgi:hypothetical protein